jgi:hypothetical protein
MEVRIEETTVRKVRLSPQNIDEVFLQRLATLTGLRPHQRIVDRPEMPSGFSRWVVQDEDSRHGSVGDEYIRKANEADEIAWKLRAVLGREQELR